MGTITAYLAVWLRQKPFATDHQKILHQKIPSSFAEERMVTSAASCEDIHLTGINKRVSSKNRRQNTLLTTRIPGILAPSCVEGPIFMTMSDFALQDNGENPHNGFQCPIELTKCVYSSLSLLPNFWNLLSGMCIRLSWLEKLVKHKTDTLFLAFLETRSRALSMPPSACVTQIGRMAAYAAIADLRLGSY